MMPAVVLILGCGPSSDPPVSGVPTPPQPLPSPASDPPLPPCGPLDRAWRLGDWSDEHGEDVLVSEGHVYVAGDFSRTVVFGEGQAQQTTLTETCNSPYEDGFVARYSLSGELDWVRQAAGCLSVHNRRMAGSAEGEVIAIGERLEAEARFDGGGSSTTLPSYGLLDTHVARWDASGRHQWARSIGAAMGDSAGEVAVGPSGEVYVTGWFDPPETWFVTELGKVVLAHTGTDDVDGYVARYEGDGSLTWAVSIGGEGEQLVKAVGVAPDGMVLVAGTFSHEAVLGSLTLPSDAPLEGQPRGFVAALTPTGEFGWAQHLGGVDIRDARATPSGVVLLGTGGEAVLGPGQPNELVLGADPVEFMAQWAGDGSLLDAHVLVPSLEPTTARSLVTLDVDEQGRLATAGMLLGEWRFAEGSDREVLLRTDDRRDPLLATWTEDGQPWCAWPIRSDTHVGSLPVEFANGVAFDEQGGVWVTGTFTGDLILGEGTPGETVLTSAGDTDVFVARFLLQAPQAP
jgi:hypothetical protein